MRAIPSEWLQPGAIVPVDAETVRELLECDAGRGQGLLGRKVRLDVDRRHAGRRRHAGTGTEDRLRQQRTRAARGGACRGRRGRHA